MLSCPDCLLRSQPLPATDDQQQAGTPPESSEGKIRRSVSVVPNNTFAIEKRVRMIWLRV